MEDVCSPGRYVPIQSQNELRGPEGGEFILSNCNYQRLINIS